LPFPSPGLHEDEEQWLSEVKSAQDDLTRGAIAFSHLNVPGVDVGEQEWVYRGEAFVVPDCVIDDPRIRLVFNGHVHKPQRVGKVRMPGAAERLNFGERNEERHAYIVNAEAMPATYHAPKLLNASRLVQFDVDVSAWSHGGHAPNTDEAIATVGGSGVDGALVKLQPLVDDQTVVDWKAIEAHLYKRGALHVAMSPPIRVEPEREKKEQATATEPPLDSAKRFIRERIRQKDERVTLLRMFKRMQADHEHQEGRQ
jgi:DNA repair exonuclease SbcCD nuclease subunit